MARKTLRLERTAYHEAGHAVAAFLMRRRVLSVTIVPDEDAGSLGHNRYGVLPNIHPDYEIDSRTVRVIEREIVVSLAGWAAEARLDASARREASYLGDDDWHKAYDLATYVTGSPEEMEAYVNWLWVRAKYMIALPPQWAAVKGLASDLLERRRIGGRRVREVIKTAMRDLVAKGASDD